MKTAKNWFAEYADSHQNPTNIAIHFICVPLIYFSIIGMLMSINNVLLVEYTTINFSLLINWASLVILPVLFFYARLSIRIFLEMLVFTSIVFIGNYYLAKIVPLFYTSLFIFIVAWIGQFYGHKVEGKKPSFFKDIQFLLIGPIWVIKKISKSK